MQALCLNFRTRTLNTLRPIGHGQYVPFQPRVVVSLFSSCKKCKVLRLSSTRNASSGCFCNVSLSRHRLMLPSKRTLLFPKNYVLQLCMINQKRLKNTNIKIEETLADADHPPDVVPYYNNIEEQEFIVETVNNGDKEEEKKSVKTNRRKKNVKNPLPSITVDGLQLTFVEETKVVAEIDALIKHNRATDAFQLFNRYRRRGHKFTIETYNQLLQGIANCGTWLQVDILLYSMRSQAVLPNYQTYAYLIEACWRMGETRKIKSFLHNMELEGLSKEHIFHESMLTKSQADAVLSALKSIDPDYAPVPPPLKERTKMPEWRLLEGLKDPIKETNVFEALPCEFKVENLGSMLDQQLENEMRGYVLVPSIEKKREVSERN